MSSYCRALLPLAISACWAQSFEVASIKPNAANDHRVMVRMQPGGRYSATGMSTRMLITQAFDLREFQVIGAPDWTASDRFDINAKAESSVERITPAQLRPMLKSLLVERFQLKYHEETKELPVYKLVVAKGGAKLKPSAAPQGAPSGQPAPQMMRVGRGQLNANAATVASVARMISMQLGRDVIDNTGLEGNYDVNLEWTPEPGQGGGFPGPLPPGAVPPADNNGPTLFTALQEQLGLRLESAKAPVTVLVIDSIAKPSEN